jgi:hypothetical protein
MLSQKNNEKQKPLLKKIRAIKNKDRIFKFLLVLILLLIFYNIPKKYLGDTYPICLYRIIFHQNCWGCGTTRAIWSIIHFNINQALEYNRLIIVTFPLLTGCIISWIVKTKKSKT